MPAYRQIHTQIWKDAWFLDLDSDHKLLFIYLFSNERANLAGLYDLALKVICFETDLPQETVEEGLALFGKADKVIYEDGWVWVPNLLRYNAQNLASPKIQKHLRDTLETIPNIALKARWIEYYNGIAPDGYRIDTVSYPIYKEQEQDQEQEQEKTGADAPAPDGATSAPATFSEWQALVQEPPDGSNRHAVLRWMFETLYPGRDPPDYGYLGKVAREVGGAGRLADLLWQHSTRPPNGDVLRYILGRVKREKGETGQRPEMTDEKYLSSAN